MASTFTEIARNENNVAGGNKELLIGLLSDLTPTIDASGYCTFAADASADIVKWVPRQNTFQVTETNVNSEFGGTTAWDQALNFFFAGRSLIIRNQIQLLANTGDLVVIVKDSNDDIRAYGAEQGLKLAPGAMSDTGLQFGGENNGYTINLIGHSVKLAPHVKSDAWTSLGG